jgi:hypothetical protein
MREIGEEIKNHDAETVTHTPYPYNRDDSVTLSTTDDSPTILGNDYNNTVKIGLAYDDDPKVSVLRLSSKLLSEVRTAACVSYSAELEDVLRTQALTHLENEGPLSCSATLNKWNAQVDQRMQALKATYPVMRTDDIRKALYSFNDNTVHVICKDSKIDPVLTKDVIQEVSAAICQVPSGAEAPSSMLGVNLYPSTLRSNVLINKAQNIIDAYQTAVCEAQANNIQTAVNITLSNNSTSSANCDVIEKQFEINEQQLREAFPGADVKPITKAWQAIVDNITNQTCVNGKQNNEKTAALINALVVSMCSGRL